MSLAMLNSGVIRYMPDVAGEVEYATVAVHECDEGFFLVGVENRTCTGDDTGTTGRWTDNASVCSGNV